MASDGKIQRVRLVAGPLAALVLLVFFDLDSDNPAVTRAAAVAVWMAIWWMTEAVPLAVTSLLPVVLFPMLGVMNGKAVSSQYFNHIIFLFMGGFMVALAMQRWLLHKRIALKALLLFGVRPRLTLLGFMAVTAFLSMWISNTATTMMMVPIVLAIVVRMEHSLGAPAVRRYSTGVFLGVAYAASLGGIATLVGTPPNLSFARILAVQFPQAPEISFANWFLFAFPVSALMLLVVWAFLSLLFVPRARDLAIDTEVFRKQYEALGPFTYEEGVVLVDFALLALLWLTRAGLRIGELEIPGWSRYFANPKFFNDGTVAVAMAVLMFLLPSAREPGKRIMDWETARALPWDIILLFGGGFALAKGFSESGLSLWLGHQLKGCGAFHPLLLIGAICLMITFLTELTSNTATTEMILPVVSGLAVAIKMNPLLLMIPTTLSCSCAFMLPVATPPNAIIFGTRRVRASEMARTGVLLNLIGVAAIALAAYFWGPVVLDIDRAAFPEWATFAPAGD
jgi:sodium-dependent dicarboxylate transporter 2/3/5